MPPDRRAAWVAGGAVATMTALALWAFSYAPGLDLAWLLPLAVVVLLWTVLEVARTPGDHEPRRRALRSYLRYFIAWVALAIASFVSVDALLTTESLGSGWHVGGPRMTGLTVAFGLVLFGNALPTLGTPWRDDREPFAWQRVHRFVGWTLVIVGLGVGTAWIALSPARASTVTNLLLALCFFVVFGRKIVATLGPSS